MKKQEFWQQVFLNAVCQGKPAESAVAVANMAVKNQPKA